MAGGSQMQGIIERAGESTAAAAGCQGCAEQK